MAVAASESIWVSTEGPGALSYPTTFAFPPLGMPSCLPHLLQSSIPSPIGEMVLRRQASGPARSKAQQLRMRGAQPQKRRSHPHELDGEGNEF